MKRPRSFSEQVRDYLVYEDGNICYGDFYYYESLVSKYGREKVEAEIKRQKEVFINRPSDF